MTIEDSAMTPHLIEIPRIPDARGNLSFIQRGIPGVPFDISRTYWIYDVPADADRHGRALRNTAEIIVPLAGAFDVTLDDGHGGTRRYHLDRPYRGLYVPPCDGGSSIISQPIRWLLSWHPQYTMRRITSRTTTTLYMRPYAAKRQRRYPRQASPNKCTIPKNLPERQIFTTHPR